MRLPEYFKYGEKGPVISFEIFPPKTEKGMENLEKVLEELTGLRPDFITVTYGAMGSARERTLEIASLIKNRFGVETACHLTCVGASREELDRLLIQIYESGIENIVAIRGDTPSGAQEFIPPPDRLKYGYELVRHIRQFEGERLSRGYFGIAVGGYPEKHSEAPDMETDIRNLKHKVDAGADIVITQLFFDNRHYFDFVERAKSHGIKTPIIPGLMPILSVKQIERITSMCGATIPSRLRTRLDACKDDDEKARAIGIAQCIDQSKELLARGAPGIHFYVLNKSDHMKEIIGALPVDRLKYPGGKFAANNP
ncbi:MAG TPA: methylenetetrahydrofolate reductase [NAD(P)H] [Thermodesulfobacteriota bacterium]|nr:methylenetetrahydrofolate reductase [NAD(P)H] [Thermodesulfobacteriota bacterium]